jgi:hypothetical protein
MSFPAPPRSRSSHSWKPRLWTPPHHPGRLNNPVRALRLRRLPPQIPHPSHGSCAQPPPPRRRRGRSHPPPRTLHAAAAIDMMPAPAIFIFSEWSHFQFFPTLSPARSRHPRVATTVVTPCPRSSCQVNPPVWLRSIISSTKRRKNLISIPAFVIWGSKSCVVLSHKMDPPCPFLDT